MSGTKPSIEMKGVTSSSIESVGYNPETRELHVRYKGSGDTYAYSDVTPEKHQAVLSADSVGKFVNSQLKGRHDFRKL